MCRRMPTKWKFISLNRAWLTTSLFTWTIFLAILSRIIYTTIDAQEMQRRKEGLESMCDQRARILQDQFSLTVNHLHALSVLLSTFQYSKSPSKIDQKTFADYTGRTTFERPLLSRVAYAQRVLNSERKEFERRYGWTIRTMNKKQPSIHDEYASIIFSQDTISYIESLDMMSGEDDHDNILRARATGNAVITKPFRLLGSHYIGVVLTCPVYKYKLPLINPTAKQRIASIAGYLGGAFDVESLVENLLEKLTEDEPISMNVCDITNSSEPILMYGHNCKHCDVSPKRVSMLDLGDPHRKHHMICWYLEDAPTSWTTVTCMFLFFVIGVLVGYTVYSILNHFVQVENDFCQMQQLKVQAEAAVVAKSQFLATISHEIRTPINGILRMLAMILDTNLSSTQRDFAQTAQACGKSLINLINEVLDRGKIEPGKLELESVPFNVRSILDDILSSFFEKSRQKGVEEAKLAVLVSENVPSSVIGDSGRFWQVITNLVGNSVKFTERGHIFVHVLLAKDANVVLDKKLETTSNETFEGSVQSDDCTFKTLSGFEAADDRNCWDDLNHITANEEHQFNGPKESVTLLVCVEDTGIGIPLDAQEHVYMPFSQADSSTSRNYGDIGTGLSISKSLVELMGGQIDFVSRPQVGSTFSFTTIFKMSDKNESVCQDSPMEFEGLTTMLVDERPLRAAITKYHLSRLGIMVEVVTAIAVAKSKIGSLRTRNEKRVDMVLVEKDTWVSSEDYLKKNGHVFKLSKMILLAPKITDDEIQKVKESGFEDKIIMKPLRASMIAECVNVAGIRKKAQKDVVVCGSGVLRGLLRGKKVLVVDDNKVNRIVAAGALKKFGANVVCVDSGKAAVDLLELLHDFEACFMDIQMPEMDGYEATRLIRKLEEEANEGMNGESSSEGGGKGKKKVERHLPILALTADVVNSTREKCIECGMDGYVSKPFEVEDLYQAIAKFLEPK